MLLIIGGLEKEPIGLLSAGGIESRMNLPELVWPRPIEPKGDTGDR